MQSFSHFKKNISSILLLYLFSATSLFAATINVPSDQPTISDAVSAANAGDIIILAPGTYIQKSKIDIDKPLTISSKWYTTGDTQYIRQTILNGVDKTNTLFETVYQKGFDVEISGLTITQFSYPIIINDTAVVQHNFMSNNTKDSISFESTSSGYIGFNTIEDARDDAIDIDARRGTFTIEFNTIRNSNDDGMEIRLLTNSQPNITYDIHDNSFNGNDEDGIQLIDHSLGDSGRIFYIYNNIFDSNSMVGLGLMGGGDTIEDYNGAPVLERINFYNNTVTNNTVGVTGGDNFIALNNIIANNTKEGIKRLRLDSVVAHSIFNNNGINISDAITDTGILLNVDPEYDPITFELSASSPSIDSGIASFLRNGELLLDQNASEYAGSAPDLGAKEFEGPGVINKNIAPTVSAGTDHVIFDPNNTISLEGVVNDDGLPLPQAALVGTWNQDEGPGIVSFVDVNDLTTTASFSQQGKYHLRLTGDDSELTASDSMVVRYVKSGNGDALSILTPGTTFFEAEDYAYLYGSAEEINDDKASSLVAINALTGFKTEAFTEHTLTVTDQEATFYVWLLGKGLDQSSDTVFISFADSPEVEVNLPSNNIYDWVKMPGSFNRTAGNWPLIVRAGEQGVTWDRLVFTTDPDFVPVVNRQPSVTAGVDQTISLPNTALLSGVVTDDGQPNATLSSIWNKVSGPGTITFSDQNNTSTVVTFSKEGTYVLELMGHDSLLQSSDRIIITVKPVNLQPLVNAGQDQTISLPNSATINGTVTDDNQPKGTLTTIWTQVSGSGTATFNDQNNVSTSVTFSQAGTYVLELVGHDSLLQTSDQVIITVKPVNFQPLVNAGLDQTISLPNTAILNGAVNDDGQPTGTLITTWSQLSGPSFVTFNDPNSSTTLANFNQAGTYVLELMGNDSQLKSTDQITITVNPANLQPTVDAGLDQIITLPNTAILKGMASDDGLPNDTLTTFWNQLSGPANVTFGDLNNVNTSVTFSQTGTYMLQLIANDGLLQSTDLVTIIVDPARASGVHNTLDIRISSKTDDAEQFSSSGFVKINSSDLELVDEGGPSKNQQVGLRFNNLSIPLGSTITKAYIQFQTDEIDSVATSLIIEGEKSDNAETFKNITNNISNRPRTASSITWNPAPWTIIGEQGPNQKTPDITTIIQEIVNQSDWLSANSLAIIITGNGERTAVSFNQNALSAPLLHIEYSDGSSKNQPPVASNLTITGLAQVDQELRAFYTYNDVDGDLEGTSTYQWLRNGSPISSATLPSYNLVAADQGALIQFEIKPAATSGVSLGATKLSPKVGPVTTVDGVLFASARVSLKSDDAEEQLSSGEIVNSRDLELVDEGGATKAQLVGLRFNNLSIPAGATISKAYIQFHTDEVDSIFTSLVIEGEAIDNAVTFSKDIGDISNRSRTLSAVTWMPLPWNIVGEAGPDQQTSNIAIIIQEIVDRVGWSSGNSLAIIISGSGERTAIAYEGSSAAAPLLYVEYN
ncbi:MAG: PKD domain-containing protein [Methylococcaceae bacterium]